MLGKLLKYDFRSMGKQFAYVWPAVLVLALVNRFTLGSALYQGSSDIGVPGQLALVNRFTLGNTLYQVSSDIGVPGQLASGLVFFLYWAIIMAMMVLTLVFVIQRFFKGLLGDEGYLMHTLPVKPWQLIFSKLICSIVTFIVSVLVGLLSIFIVIPFSTTDMLNFWPLLFTALSSQGINGILAPLEILLLLLVSLAQCCLHLYLAMAIGHLFNKNRILMSIVAFLAINFVVSLIFSSATFSFFSLVGEQITELLYDRMQISVWGMFHMAVGLLILGSAAAAGVYFFFTERILHRRLNLE